MCKFIHFILCLSVLSFSLCSCSSIDNLSDNSKAEIIDKGDCFYDNFDLESGNLKFQVLDCSWYNNIADANLKYSDFIEVFEKVNPQTGEVLDGAILVLVDISVENEGAIPLKEYRFSDDITFRADGLQLVNVSKKVTDDNYECYPPNYFSDSDECAEHFFAYKLENGNSRNYKLGYIAESNDLENLFLCTASGNVNSTFIKLDLTK